MDDDLHRLGFKLKFAYSVIGLILGLSCILAGVVLGLNGVTGHSSWTASLLGLSTTLNDAAPGVVVFIVGIFMVLITRFKVSHERFSPAPPEAGDGASGSAPKPRGGGRARGPFERITYRH